MLPGTARRLRLEGDAGEREIAGYLDEPEPGVQVKRRAVASVGEKPDFPCALERPHHAGPREGEAHAPSAPTGVHQQPHDVVALRRDVRRRTKRRDEVRRSPEAGEAALDGRHEQAAARHAQVRLKTRSCEFGVVRPFGGGKRRTRADILVVRLAHGDES